MDNNRFAEALENINIGYNDFGAYLKNFYRDLGRDNIEGAIRQTVCQSAYGIPKRGSPAVNGYRFVENKPDGDLSVTIILRSRVSYG